MFCSEADGLLEAFREALSSFLASPEPMTAESSASGSKSPREIAYENVQLKRNAYWQHVNGHRCLDDQ